MALGFRALTQRKVTEVASQRRGPYARDMRGLWWDYGVLIKHSRGYNGKFGQLPNCLGVSAFCKNGIVEKGSFT